ncbi:MAG: type II toxin-antitoxin system RelE/ParE family toxin [Saprospiraceae bacterium]|nr:type II toxin-antitoxin system RelE/ParE family toxin [Saprospiraceae bacterium]
MMRKIFAYGDYFDTFYKKQDQKSRDKIDFVLDLLKHEKHVPKKFLKHLEGTDSLYEIRVSAINKEIRIFSFFDQGNLVVLANCIVKKTQKTPKNALELAIKLKKEYFKNKDNEQA